MRRHIPALIALTLATLVAVGAFAAPSQPHTVQSEPELTATVRPTSAAYLTIVQNPPTPTLTPEPTATPLPTRLPTATPRTGGVEVLGNHTLYYGGTWRVVGEVRNATHHPVYGIRVTIDYYDDQHYKLGTTSRQIDSPLLPDDKTCFDITLSAPIGETISYTFEPPTYYTSNTSSLRLPITGDHSYFDSQYHEYHLAGQISNNQAAPMVLGTLVGTLYGANGQVFDCNAGWANSLQLDPGQTVDFDLKFDHHHPPTEYATVARYRLQIYGYPKP